MSRVAAIGGVRLAPSLLGTNGKYLCEEDVEVFLIATCLS